MQKRETAIKKILDFAADSAAVFRRVAAAFLGVQETDSKSVIGKKAARTTSDRTLYAAIDWSMDAVEAAGIITLYSYGYDPIVIGILAWVFELVCAGFFLVFWYKFERDFPLGKNSRRAVDQLKKETGLIGKIIAVGVVCFSFFWEGPEKIIIYYEEKFDTTLKVMSALLVLTASHAAIWTLGSVLVVEAVMKLW